MLLVVGVTKSRIVSGLNSFGSGYNPVVSSGGHGKDPLDAMCNRWEFFSLDTGLLQHQHQSSNSLGWLYVKLSLGLSHQTTVAPLLNVQHPSANLGQKLTISPVLVTLTNTSLVGFQFLMLCSVIRGRAYRRFGGTYCLHFQGILNLHFHKTRNLVCWSLI
jgi:hypothetical protein